MTTFDGLFCVLLAATLGSVPKYLQDKPSELYVRDGDKLVKAPQEDVVVARAYSEFSDKGEIHDGQRITIMTARTQYRIGEEIRVIHVLEAPVAGHKIYVMGPKMIQEEYVDGQLASAPSSGFYSYDGLVIDSPGVDFNYEISIYKFTKPGTHLIQWKGGGHPIQGNLDLTSNVLHIDVKN
jgi:hypothetical protein